MFGKHQTLRSGERKANKKLTTPQQSTKLPNPTTAKQPNTTCNAYRHTLSIVAFKTPWRIIETHVLKATSNTLLKSLIQRHKEESKRLENQRDELKRRLDDFSSNSSYAIVKDN